LDQEKKLNMYQEKVLDQEEKLTIQGQKLLDQEKQLIIQKQTLIYQEEKLLMQQQQILDQDEKIDRLLSKISLLEQQNQMFKTKMECIKIIILICAIVGCMIMLVK